MTSEEKKTPNAQQKGCILEVDSPCYPASWGEHLQCGCNSCLKALALKAVHLLKATHGWFMKAAPEHYNGCGLWIDVDCFLAEIAADSRQQQPQSQIANQKSEMGDGA